MGIALVEISTKKAASKLALIGVVMLLEALAFAAIAAAFERKAGQVYFTKLKLFASKKTSNYLLLRNDDKIN